MAISSGTQKRLEQFVSSSKFQTLAPETQQRIRSFLPQEPVGLPGASRVEALQEERVPASERLREETSIPFSGGLGQRAIKGAVTGLKGIAVPFERAESAIAAPLERLQAPQTLFAESIKRDEPAIKTLGREALKGLKGEKVTELGDIPRRAGVPEPISAFIGFGSSIAALDPLLGGPVKAIGKSLGKVGRALTGFKKGTEVLKPGKFSGVLDDLTKTMDDADALRKTLGANVAESIKKSGVTFAKETVDDIVNKIPSKFMKKVFDEDVITALDMKVIRNAKGKVTGVVPDADNVWKLGRAIRDAMSVKAVRETAGDIVTGKAKSVASSTRKLLNQLPKEAQKSLDDFSKFVDNFRKVERNVRGTSGIIKEKGIRGLETGKVEEGVRMAFKELSEFLPEIKNIVAKSSNIARKQAIGKAAKGTARGLAGIGLLRGAFRGVGGGSEPLPEVK